MHRLTVATHGKGLVEITREVLAWTADQGIGTGLLTLWCRHTSASLTVQENADPTVREDIARYFEALVPEDPRRYLHGEEGSDDMPAHLRTVLTQSALMVPVARGRLDLGTWQGLYLWEHRTAAHRRRLTVTLL